MWDSNLRIAVLQNVRLVHLCHAGCSVTFSPELQVNCYSNFDPQSLMQEGKGSTLPPAAEVASRSRGNSHSFLYACREKANCFPNSLFSLQDKRRVLFSHCASFNRQLFPSMQESRADGRPSAQDWISCYD